MLINSDKSGGALTYVHRQDWIKGLNMNFLRCKSMVYG